MAFRLLLFVSTMIFQTFLSFREHGKIKSPLVKIASFWTKSNSNLSTLKMNSVDTVQLDDVCNRMGMKMSSKHLFLCVDQTKPKCCNLEVGIVAWNHLKKRVKEINNLRDLNDNIKISRTKANCLQVCVQNSGPIAVVYPDGIWYHSCTPDVLDSILDSHILKGIPVEQYRFNHDNSITNLMKEV